MVEILIDGEQCEHGDSWLSNCSDCCELEASDNISIDILTDLLPELRNLLIGYHIRDRIYEIAEGLDKISRDAIQNGLDDEIINSIFSVISINSIMKKIK